MIDDLLGELQAAGRVDSEGAFTMDRAKAREKLRRFQLADPRRYVLELVQAASLKGASSIRFVIDGRYMVMEHDGRPFTTADFDDVYAAAFVRSLDRDVLARRQLALGLTSAMALRPRWIEVESGDGSAGARLRLVPDGEDVFEAVATPRKGTWIQVCERFGLGTFAAWIRDMSGTLAEEQLLRARCRQASFAIHLEGTRLSRGLVFDPDDEMLHVVEREHGHTRLVCGLHPSGAGTRLRIIKDGVWITDHDPAGPGLPPGLRAIVQDHALRKDVSQADIVRDDAYAAMMTVLRHAAARSLALLARAHEDGTAPVWAEGVLEGELGRLVESGARLDRDEDTGLVRALRRLPLWYVDEQRRVSLDALLTEADTRGRVAYTARSHRGSAAIPKDLLVVRTSVAAHAAILQSVLGDRLHDVTATIERHDAWRARPTAPVLPEAAYLCRQAFAGPGVRGELGITADPTDRASLTFVVDGCSLVQLPLGQPWIGLRAIVEAQSFRPTPDFDGIERSLPASMAILHALTMITGVYAELARAPASPWRDACAMPFVRALLRGDSLVSLWPSLPGRAIAAFGAERLRFPKGLKHRTAHPLLRVPLFATLGPRRWSVLELAERDRAGETLGFVAAPVEGVVADVLVLDATLRDCLQAVLRRPLVDASDFLTRSATPPRLDSSAPAVVVPIEGDGITGRLRVEPRVDARTCPQEIGVLHLGRSLDTISLLLVGACEGWVESTAVEPAPGFEGARDDEALDDVRAAVLRAFVAASLRIAERFVGMRREHDAAFLREVVALVFPGPGLRALHDVLVDGDRSVRREAVAIHRRLYAVLHTNADPAAFDRELRALSEQREGPMQAALAMPALARSPARSLAWALAAVYGLFPAGHPHDLAGRALQPDPRLGALPLFSSPAGRDVTVDELREAVARGQTVVCASTRGSMDTSGCMVVVADEAQYARLCRIVGHARVERGHEETASRRRPIAPAPTQRSSVEPAAVEPTPAASCEPTPVAPAPAAAPRAPAPAPRACAPAPHAPAPALREPTPEERLVDALRAELGLLRARNEGLLAELHLDRLHVRPLSGTARALVALADAEGVIVNRDHPVVQRALAEHATDPVWCHYVASAVYTALNVWLAAITDDDERTFLERLAELAAGRSSPPLHPR